MLSFFTTSFAILVKPARPVVELSGRARRSARRTSRYARLLQLSLGLLGVGIGIGTVLQADLGVASWDVLNVALSRRLEVPLGVVSVAVGLLAGGVAVMLGARARWRALIPLFVVAPVLEATVRTVPTPATLSGQLAMLLVGMMVMALGVGAYIGSENGAGPADMLFLQLAERGLPIWVARVALDGTVVLLGGLLGGPIGLGTIVVTAGMGPMVARTLRWFDLVDAHAAAARRAARHQDRAASLPVDDRPLVEVAHARCRGIQAPTEGAGTSPRRRPARRVRCDECRPGSRATPRRRRLRVG